jgi:photosystem II stability/assembly factor-like uncharacterized protein
MKVLHGIVIFLFMIYGQSAQSQSWVELNIPAGIYPLSLDFVSPNMGWVIDNYSVMKTEDGGETWQMQSIPSESLMNSVCFVSELQGWIAADNGIIWHTSDGGVTWSTQNSGTPYSLKEIFFIDELHGWAIGGGPGLVGTFLYTVDGGVNWLSTECPCLFNDLDFHSTTQGWMVCDNGQTYSTYDGGVTIEALELDNSISLRNVDFINDGIGWRVGESNLLQQTLNGGLAWYDEVSPLDVFMISGLSFANISVGAISGSSSVAVTTDGGDTWDVTQIPNSFIADVEMINEFTGYAVTGNGVIKYCSLGILTQPESLTTAEGSPVQLYAQADAFGASYQWQAFIFGEWVDLTDNSAYTGTNSNVLSIAAAYGNMTFRCVISFQNCIVITNEAIISTTTLVSNLNTAQLSVYPNPATNNITLNVGAEMIGGTYKIYDALGREVMNGKLSSASSMIDVDSLARGSYRIAFVNAKAVASKALILE